MKQFAVVGLGRFGMAVARHLSQRGFQVLAVDRDPGRVAEAAEFVTRAIELNATDEESLRNSRISKVDAAVVGIGKDISASILITLILKNLGIKTVFSKASSPLQGKVLEKIGADRVVYAEKEMGEKVAESLVSPGISEYIKLSPDCTLMEVDVPHSFEDKTIGVLAVREKYGVQIVALKRKVTHTDRKGRVGFNENVIVAPGPNDGVIEGDRLVVLGENKNIDKIRKLK
jgi:trk system potassium uptake protein TrkA